MQTVAMISSVKPAFKASTPRIARQQTVIVRAQAEQSTRRAALMAGVAALIGLGAAEAEAKMINKSSSSSSASGYTMEGTKKRGVDRTRKSKLLEKARAKAEKAASK